MATMKQNLNPTAEAFVAMLIWGNEYSKQDGGSMDFYESLSPSRKKQCESSVLVIVDAYNKRKHGVVRANNKPVAS